MNLANMLLMMATIAVPVLFAVVLFLALKWWSARDRRRSPLYGKLHHAPGEQLRQRIRDLEDDMDATFAALAASGPLLLLAWALPRVEKARAWESIAWYVLAMLVLAAFLVWRLWRLRTSRRQCQDGLAAELMTAQQLTPLMGEGRIVLNDVPGKGFNLDHVVVGQRAVFAVETKSHRKPPQKGKQSAQVRYDGKCLQFSDNTVRVKPVDQARHQARWLETFLRGAVGEPVPVIPVLALPGWYVVAGKDAHQSDVRVINPKMHGVFNEGPAQMPDHLRNRIIHALTERYPDIEE